MEIGGKNSTDLQPEGALDGSNRKPNGILYYLNFAFIVLLMLAFILYYAYYYFGVNLSLQFFFLSMIGLIIFNTPSKEMIKNNTKSQHFTSNPSFVRFS